jgi:hypothetical protein
MDIVQRKRKSRHDNTKAVDVLRSWVQIIPIGPLFTVVQLSKEEVVVHTCLSFKGVELRS